MGQPFLITSTRKGFSKKKSKWWVKSSQITESVINFFCQPA
jgi:hypothetical protein